MIPLEVWLVVCLQMVLGSADIIIHHEFIARLAWQPSARRELRLHGLRNLLHGGIFLVLAWVTPLGWTVLVLVGLFALEVAITFIDRLEQDARRRLPGTERALHGLLAINFGVLLALLAPTAWSWFVQPTAVEWVHRGIWSWMASAAAVGVLAMALRDFSAARRVARLRSEPLDLELAGRRRWLVTGATGFVGQRLTEALADAGQEVTVLTRQVARAAVLTSPFRVLTSLDDVDAGERFDVIVHLAGESVAGGLWTRARRQRIERSRPDLTERLSALMDRLESSPEALICASAVGWYGDRGDAVLDEGAEFHDGFTHRVCAAAEAAAARAERPGLRAVSLRIGLVLNREGGFLGQLLVPFDLGLGGALGSGGQWMSWIERDDLVRLIVHAATDAALHGPLNAVAPQPVTNRDFTKALAGALGRPAWFRLPRFLLVGLLGEMAKELMLASQRAVPAKAVESGFEFRCPDLKAALAKALS